MNPTRIRSGVIHFFRLPLRGARVAAREADAELAAVIDAKADYLVARGMSPDAARTEAARALGVPLDRAYALVRESAARRDRTLGMREWLDDLRADGRYAARALVRSPAFVSTTSVTLALAIGAITAIYAAVNAVVVRPLPYADAGRLVTVGEDNPDFGWRLGEAAPANFLDWKERVRAFAGVGAISYSPIGEVTVTGVGAPRVFTTAQASGNLFSVLSVTAMLGRTFEDAETWQHNGPSAVLLSYRAWHDGFGSDPGIIGRGVQVDGRRAQIVGLLPARFVIPGMEVDVWEPFAWDAANRDQTWFRRAHFLRVIARLAPGVTPDGANAALQVVVRDLQRQYPATNTHMGASLEPLHDFLVGSARLPLAVALAAAGALLLVACANVGNLMLVRAAGRARESAVRRALGAEPWRLVTHVLMESLLLAALGGAAGIALGWWGTSVLATLMPHDMLPVHDLTLNPALVGLVFGVTAVCGLAFGAGAALWSAHRQPTEVLREEGPGAGRSVRSRRWGDTLLVTQVAIALALTLGAGLLVRSYVQLQRVDPGFDPHGVLAARIDLPSIRYDSGAKISGFYQNLLERARALPGVQSAAIASVLPLTGPPWSSEFAVAGRPPLPRGGDVVHREVSPDYQRVMHVPLLRGRLFTEADRGDAPLVVLINETLARTYFPQEDPIGQRIAFDRVPDSTSHWRMIVGVIGDERQTRVGEPPRPEFIAPAAQDLPQSFNLLLKTGKDPRALASGVRRIVAALDPELAIANVQTMADVRAASLARDRFLMMLFLAFAAVGVILGIVGVYGVVAQLARRRTREIAVRVALGATRWQVQWFVVRRGLGLSALGIGIGVALALELTGLMRALLYDVAPLDPATFAGVPVLLLLTTALASWWPAARASRADATDVLKAD